MNADVALLVRSGRIIDPACGVDRVDDLLVAGGVVSRLGPGPLPPGCAIIEARGFILCPGFIDLHCHLREPGFEEKETIATGTLAGARGGFTTLCCMPNTAPPIDSSAAVEQVKAIAAAEGVVRVLPIGCVTRGRAGSGLAPLEEMARAGAAGFSDDGSPVSNSLLMRQALERCRDLGLPVIDHCEDTSLTAGGQINEGEISARLGLRGMPAAAEDIIVARDLALAGLTGGHLHIAHVSTEGSVDLIRRAKDKGINVTAEVTPHHLTLTEEAVVGGGASAKVNPPLRTKKDIRALIQGLREGVIDAVATDHAPHTDAEKRLPFDQSPFGISGLETALGSLMSLVHGGDIDLGTLVASLTSRPARVTGRDDLGTLRPGAPADITIFDPDTEWTVDPAQFASKGKNTPLAGAVLRGRVMATIYGGRLVYRDGSTRVGELERGFASLI
ncbi:MAG: dihydroorotase [Chloroflexi bacterium]|nr:dihydroorotase [Chloroflexota bacterium]